RGLGFPQPFGPWGFVGTTLAAEQGFMAGNEPLTGPGPAGGPFGGLPTAARAAAGKSFNILENCNNAQYTQSTSIIDTLNNYISTEVGKHGELRRARGFWSACMAKDGFSTPVPSSFWQQALTALGQRPPSVGNPSGPPAPPTAAQNKQQIAMAVA